MFRLAGRLSWWWKEAGRQIGRDRLTARSILLKTTVLSDGGCTSAPLSATDYSLFLSSSSSSKRNRSKIEGSEDGPPRSVVEGWFLWGRVINGSDFRGLEKRWRRGRLGIDLSKQENCDYFEYSNFP